MSTDDAPATTGYTHIHSSSVVHEWPIVPPKDGKPAFNLVVRKADHGPWTLAIQEDWSVPDDSA